MSLQLTEPKTETKIETRMRPPRNRLLRVPTLKPSRDPEGPEGSRQYTIHYVTSAGKATEVPCTHQVYKWLAMARPWHMVQKDFVLSIDPTSGTVVHVTEAQRPSPSPIFQRVSEGKPASKNVILTLHEDRSVRLKELPDRINDNIINEIQNAVADFEGDIHPGIKVGRFNVAEKHEVLGAVELHIDPMPSQ